MRRRGRKGERGEEEEVRGNRWVGRGGMEEGCGREGDTGRRWREGGKERE